MWHKVEIEWDVESDFIEVNLISFEITHAKPKLTRIRLWQLKNTEV